MKALAFGEVTCLGFFEKKFPRTSGNCFSVKCDDGQYYRIVNFCYENLKELEYDVARFFDSC